MNQPSSLAQMLDDLESGRYQARELLESCFERIVADNHAKARVYTKRFQNTARAEADAIDSLGQASVPSGQLAGMPIALKALFDVAGEVTHAGSQGWQTPAQSDALIVSRLRREGAVITGHTNMTEFAYSGLGLNPHYGTPDNPLAPGRIPGGSSSGAAVAVARGMAAGAIGTDTGGSVRIPAAFCGLVGFKPSQFRVPREGSFPLSDSLDSIGPIARTVDCCARLDTVLSGRRYQPLRPVSLKGLRFVVPTNYMLSDLDDTVAQAFSRSLNILRDAGASIIEESAPVLAAIPELMEGGGFIAAESYFVHRQSLADRGDLYDPRVRSRIERGAAITAADYLELCRRRQQRKQEADEWLQNYDGLLAPTVPVVPPQIEELAADDDYARVNLLILRNTSVANMLDLCSVTLPDYKPGDLPSGLMLNGRNGTDDTLLRLAQAIERVL